MAADWDTSGIHERRVDERMAPEPRRGWLGARFGGWSRGRRRTAGVLTGLVSVAIIAGYIWSGTGDAVPEAGVEPPLIQADEGPIRVAPEKPGGMEIPHRDKLVLQRLPGAEEDPRRERLLPPPEEPLPPPQEEPVAAYEPPGERLPPSAPPRESLPEPQTTAPVRSGETGRAVAPSATEPARPVVKTEPTPPARTQAPPAQARLSDGPTRLIPRRSSRRRSAPRRWRRGGTYVWPSDGGRSADAPRAACPRARAANGRDHDGHACRRRRRSRHRPGPARSWSSSPRSAPPSRHRRPGRGCAATTAICSPASARPMPAPTWGRRASSTVSAPGRCRGRPGRGRSAPNSRGAR